MLLSSVYFVYFFTAFCLPALRERTQGQSTDFIGTSELILEGHRQPDTTPNFHFPRIGNRSRGAGLSEHVNSY